VRPAFPVAANDSEHPVKNYTTPLIVITLVLVGFFLTLYVREGDQAYLASQESMMQHSTLGTARMITLYLEETRRHVRLFAEEESDIIGELSRNPANGEMRQRFADRVKRHFPDYFAYTITGAKGNVLLDDLEGKVMELCQEDIRNFAAGKEQKVVIHPNPEGYHFDIMSRWRDGEKGGIFFISFTPAALARILANSQLHGHQFILLHRDKPGLIEVTARGSRADLKTDITLNPDEMRRIGFSTDVPGTLWVLADLPDAGLYDAHRHLLQRQAAFIFLVFLLFSGGMYALIRREERQRTRAEQEVRESQYLLEERVAERTGQLSSINTRLESEIHERQQAEQALKREISERRLTGDTLRALHEITSAQNLPFLQRLRALLENGCRQFNLPIGILSHIHEDKYEVIQIVSPDDSIRPGDVLELGNTYCRETINASGPIGFEYAGGSQWKTHPCYREYKLETYIGIPVVTGTQVYGTLNFSSPRPRLTLFTETDREILGLMGQWVGSEIHRQQTERSLKIEKDNAQRYLDVAGVIMLIIGADQRVTLINRKGSELLGYAEQDIVGRNWFDTFVPPGDRESLRGSFIRLMTGQENCPEYVQHPVRTSTAEERLIAWHTTVLTDEAGGITATLSSGEDITERKQAREQLQQREEQLRLTLEHAPIGILTAGLDGRLLSVNPMLCDILGYTADELTRLSIIDITHPDDRESTWQQFQALLEGSISSCDLEKHYLRKDGVVITVRARAGLVRDTRNQPLMVVGEIEDITRHKRAEKLFRLVVESAPNGIVMVDTEGRIALVNSQLEKYFGYRRDELLGQPIEMLIPERLRGRHDEYRSRFLDEHRARAMGLGRSLFGLRKDGSEFPVEIGLSPVETEHETHILASIVDISERMQFDQEMQRMRSYLKNIIDSMPSVLVGVDAGGRVTEWNQSAEQATGVPTGKAIGQYFGALFPELESQLGNLQESMRTHSLISTERLTLITDKNDETRYADVMVYPLVTNGAVGAVIRVDDITERVRIEQMMVQTEKMMSVGGLAAGMAHEINNPLSGVLQSSQNIQRRLLAEVDANRRVAESLGVDLQLVYRYLEERGILEFVESIRQAASRASRIVADMLAFSRSTSTEFQPARLEDIIDTAVRLAANDYDLKKKYDFRQVEIVRDPDPALDTLNCDPTEIEQVILNLVKNAAQAMALSGSPPPHRITLRTRREEDYARIEVEDTGPGMDEVTRRRVFEPFFTTKAVGAGTGLGLSVSYFIVTEQHKGTIDVNSVPGEGTCFIVRLPLKGKPR
jgi:PAS domain S-box-containing protein